MTARKEAGLSNVTDKEYKDNFIAFMVEDKQLPYLDFDQDLWRFKEV